MKGNTSKVKTDYHDFDEYFSRNVIEATREDPERRIAFFADNLMDQRYKGKVIESILCTRKCCQVVTQGGENKSNIDLIKEYLYSNDEGSRKNAAVIAKNIFSEKNANTVIRSYSFMSNFSSLLEAIVKSESLKKEAKDIIENIFSKENMKNEELLGRFPSLLGAMVKNESLKDEAGDIIKKLLSKENIGTVLKSETFMRNLPSLLKAMVENESLKDEAGDIIKKLLSKENIGTALKNQAFMWNLPSLLKSMTDNNGDFKRKVKYIIEVLFSKENIDAVSKNEGFAWNLTSLLENMADNGGFKDEVKLIMEVLFLKENLPLLLAFLIENESFGNEVKYIIKNISSYKNFGSILDRVDTSLARFVSRDIVKGLAKEMLEKEYNDFEKKATNIIKNQISSKNIMPELSSSSTQKEMLNRENSSARDGINGSLKSIMPMLDSSFSKKVMSNYRNKTEDSASDFIRNILGNNSVPKELKSELKALLDDFSAKRRKFIPQELIEEEEKTINRKLAVFLREG